MIPPPKAYGKYLSHKFHLVSFHFPTVLTRASPRKKPQYRGEAAVWRSDLIAESLTKESSSHFSKNRKL